MRTVLFCLLGIGLLPNWSHAQFSFERFPKPKYKKTKWIAGETYTARIDKLFSDGAACTLTLVYEDDGMMLKIFKGETKVHMSLEEINPTYGHPVQWADLNGDGLQDLKLDFPFAGNGLAGYNHQVIYLLQRQARGFDKHTLMNKFEGLAIIPERDLDRDGRFEVIVRDHQILETGRGTPHAYWFFNVYAWQTTGERSGLKNQNARFQYPRYVQHRHKASTQLQVAKQPFKTAFHLETPPYYQYNDGN